MSLRASTGPTLSTRSATVGQVVTITVKVENSSLAQEVVALHVEALREGALGKPLDHPFVFEPPSALLPPKSRKPLIFTWVASLPVGRDAHTFRGKLVLRVAGSGRLVASVPLDLYVRQA
ncbi:MAG: hypothetical protein WDA16_03500 [Candidatus Thermoplasmatota archaeon]